MTDLAFAHLFMDNDCLPDLIPYGKHRIQGGHWFLKNHGYTVSPNPPHLLFSKIQKILPLEQDLPPHDLSRRLGDKTENGQG